MGYGQIWRASMSIFSSMMHCAGALSIMRIPRSGLLHRSADGTQSGLSAFYRGRICIAINIALSSWEHSRKSTSWMAHGSKQYELAIYWICSVKVRSDIIHHKCCAHYCLNVVELKHFDWAILCLQSQAIYLNKKFLFWR